MIGVRAADDHFASAFARLLASKATQSPTSEEPRVSSHTDRAGFDDGRVRRLAVGVIVVVAVLLASSAAPSGAASQKPTVATAPFTTPTGVALAETPPPWALPADAKPYIAAAGLSVLSQEQLEVHYHAHLDIIANDKKVTVPAGIGFVIDNGRATGITVLHTHDASGIVHIESASNDVFTLGQLFTEWGVALNTNQIGGLKADGTHALRAYVNGRRLQGDPATIRLKHHLEITLWYGPAGANPKVPKSYRFPEGL
jgi:hypothetical protein